MSKGSKTIEKIRSIPKAKGGREGGRGCGRKREGRGEDDVRVRELWAQVG